MLNHWTSFNHTTTDPLTNSITDNGTLIEYYAYQDGDSGTSVEHYKIVEGIMFGLIFPMRERIPVSSSGILFRNMISMV